MSDHFALLDEPRRPWLDEAGLKTRFFRLSTDVHPDRSHNAPAPEKARAAQRYLDLNTAYQCLAEPRDRLRHLLELELGAPLKDVQRIPPGTMDLFVEVGQLCREADGLAAEREKISSPMLKVQHFHQVLERTDQLNALQQRVNVKRDELFAELQALNTAWETAPPPGAEGRRAALPLERLEQIYRVLSYVTRWTEQIQERTARLAV